MKKYSDTAEDLEKCGVLCSQYNVNAHEFLQNIRKKLHKPKVTVAGRVNVGKAR